ncbi:MAG: 50S ribosomal protein L30 [Bacteroidota bacterium]
MSKLKITQTRSTIRRSQVQKRTIEALGLGRIGKSVEQNDTPQIQGMIAKVKHLIAVEPVDAA